ncbi:FUSC family protein [Cellulomonas sp. PhB143]|uniref:FUSC family protein n=1 Tax=Cellulomonas sp. PhB143 TaxID=2485186 RepID=UPI000F46CA95|nr:FUSC family protein [Cellulomonas sp. PhB143]ROS75465.1 fusaric acid resistance family protein [Cellulomonas sp. PhB143]
MTSTPGPRAAVRPAIAWSWRGAALGLAYAVPGAVATALDPATGLALAVGVLPAAALGLRGPRRRRALVVLVGALAGLSMILGSLVAGTPVLAVATIFVLCVLAALATARPARRLAPLVLALGLPLVGAGLSETPSAAVGAALLLLAGSVYAWLVSLLWPESAAPPRAPRPVPSRALMLRYGIQIGAAGAAAAALGLAAGIDHPGWACTAALLVSRPRVDLLRSRGVGRAASVLVGALVACTVGALDPGPLVVALVATAAIVCATATSGSRWYVLPAFTTAVVLSMLVARDEAGVQHWFVERVGETLVGVALALAAAWVAGRVGRADAPSAPGARGAVGR